MPCRDPLFPRLGREMTEAAQAIRTPTGIDRSTTSCRRWALGVAGPFACHRPQPAAGQRRVPIPGRHRALPDQPVRRPTDPTSRASPMRRPWPTARGLLAALPRAPRGQAAAIKARHGYALLSMPIHHSHVPRFSRAGSGHQSRHRRWAHGLTGVAKTVTAAARVRRATRASPQQPLQGWLYHPAVRPAARIDALQLELSQVVYMEEEPPFRLREDRAAGPAGAGAFSKPC